MAGYFRGDLATDERRIKLVRALLATPRTDGPSLIALTGLGMTSVYYTLRRMVRDGWLQEVRVAGTRQRDYVVTRAGRRGLEFLLAVATQSDDSRSSSPTAERNSS